MACSLQGLESCGLLWLAGQTSCGQARARLTARIKEIMLFRSFKNENVGFVFSTDIPFLHGTTTTTLFGALKQAVL